MAKVAGGVRPVSRGGVAYQNRLKEYRLMMLSDAYSDGYFSETGGGYYVIENSPAKHKAEELEAAKHLADSGYLVTLTNEAGNGIGVKSPDGKVFKATFEQRTPSGSSVKKCLDHAMEKRAEVAVIYDKHHIYHRDDIENGIKDFGKHYSYKFNKILVIDSNGKVHTHKQ